jgi:hypothetical protein
MRKRLDLAAIKRSWESYYDKMLERMQTPEARRRMKEAFDASPEELGRAAVEYAKWCNGCRYGSHCLGADPDCGCGCK